MQMLLPPNERQYDNINEEGLYFVRLHRYTELGCHIRWLLPTNCLSVFDHFVG